MLTEKNVCSNTLAGNLNLKNMLVSVHKNTLGVNEFRLRFISGGAKTTLAFLRCIIFAALKICPKRGLKICFKNTFSQIKI